jgi:hypothetical protein
MQGTGIARRAVFPRTLASHSCTISCTGVYIMWGGRFQEVFSASVDCERLPCGDGRRHRRSGRDQGWLSPDSNLYRMTERTGIEYGLTRETIGGQRVFHLYSGGPNAVTMPGGLGVRNIGHTHPSGSRLPSDPDIGNINFQYLRNLKSDPYAPVPHRRVIYGPGDTDSTIYYPTEMR